MKQDQPYHDNFGNNTNENSRFRNAKVSLPKYYYRKSVPLPGKSTEILDKDDQVTEVVKRVIAQKAVHSNQKTNRVCIMAPKLVYQFIKILIYIAAGGLI